jgi:hypothetical protein
VKRYPDDTTKISSLWFDPHADDCMEQGPLIEITVYIPPNMRWPERLSVELECAVHKLQAHLGQELHPDDHSST